MAGEISKKVSIPIGLPIAKGEPMNTMPSGVRKHCIVAVHDLPSLIQKAMAEVDIFKPHRKEAFIEAVN
jgi:hypothetical protein